MHTVSHVKEVGATKFVQKNTLQVPKLKANLFLVSKVVSNGLKVQFNLNECILQICDNKTIAIVSREDNLYEMNFTKIHRAYTPNLV